MQYCIIFRAEIYEALLVQTACECVCSCSKIWKCMWPWSCHHVFGTFDITMCVSELNYKAFEQKMLLS